MFTQCPVQPQDDWKVKLPNSLQMTCPFQLRSQMLVWLLGKMSEDFLSRMSYPNVGIRTKWWLQFPNASHFQFFHTVTAKGSNLRTEGSWGLNKGHGSGCSSSGHGMSLQLHSTARPGQFWNTAHPPRSNPATSQMKLKRFKRKGDTSKHV